MNRYELLKLLKELSKGFVDKKIDGGLYAYITESLIMLNLESVPELEDFADFLAQYHPHKDLPELYSDEELKLRIYQLFKIKKND